jgi:hypothetical protein
LRRKNKVALQKLPLSPHSKGVNALFHTLASFLSLSVLSLSLCSLTHVQTTGITTC